ncbi:MAG: hypothetical protein AAEI92_08155 [Arenicellales bacterium]
MEGYFAAARDMAPLPRSSATLQQAVAERLAKLNQECPTLVIKKHADRLSTGNSRRYSR